MNKTILGVIFLTGGFVAMADSSDRAKLAGKWLLQTHSEDDKRTTWTIENNGDSIRITIAKGDRGIADFACNSFGKECEVKAAEKLVHVSFYFNGPKLIEMETQGSEIVKRRFSLVGQGDTLELEVIPLVPSGKSETFHLDRLRAGTTTK